MDMYSNKHALELKIFVILAGIISGIISSILLLFLIPGIIFCIRNVLKFFWNGEHRHNGQQSENEEQLEMGILYRINNLGNEFYEIESANPPEK